MDYTYDDFSDYSDYSSSYDYSGYDSGAADAGVAAALLGGGLGIGMMILIFVVWLALVIFSLYVAARIIGKMGYSPWLVLLFLIPLAGPIMMIYFAFVEWPIQKKLNSFTGGSKEVSKS